MKWIEIFRDAIKIFKQERLTTCFSLIGIVIGVACMASFIALQSLAKMNYQNATFAFGQNQFVVTLLPRTNKDRTLLNFEKWETFLEANPSMILAPFSQLRLGQHNVLAVMPSALPLFHVDLKAGRLLNPLDRFSKVVLVGDAHPLAHELGQTLSLENDLLTIIGVFHAEPQPLLEMDLNHMALVHLNLPKKLGWGESIDTSWGEGDIEAFKAYFNLHFQGYDFYVRDSQYYLQHFSKQLDLFQGLLSKIGLSALVFGALSLCNLRLISLQKRQSEIGIRMALGAHPFNIACLFQIESMALGSVGGMLGVVLAEIITRGIVVHLDWIYQINLWSDILVISGAIGLSAMAGLYPAVQAARLKPSFLLTSH